MIPDAEFARMLADVMPDVWRFAKSRCRDKDAADDLTQDVMERAWARRDQYRDDKNFTGWCVQIAANRHIDLTRKDALRQTQPLERDDGSPIDAALDGGQDSHIALAEVLEIIRGMSATRQAVLASPIVGQTETGEHLGMTLGTVRATLFRVRQELRQIMHLRERDVPQIIVDFAMDRRRQLLEAQA